MEKEILNKDEKLDYMLNELKSNVARFVSVSNKNLKHRKYAFSEENNLSDAELKDMILHLIDNSNSKSVNIRSFSHEIMKGNKLVFCKKKEDIEEIIDTINNNILENKFSIVNENIDINDGGVSGVLLGDIIEFSPKDTPKCVDKDGICSLPKDMGLSILEKVYGFKPNLKFDRNYRVEFSIHPTRQGVRNDHTILWEYEYFEFLSKKSKLNWPNNFSKFIGDKAFGLLVASEIGLKIPETCVISRNLPPFIFGEKTGLNEKWLRTCPVIKEPGKYATLDYWSDPFKLMQEEEFKGSNEVNIASLLSQNAVEALFSGASFISASNIDDVIEGVNGKGNDFMIGITKKTDLPEYVLEKLYKVHDHIRSFNWLIGEVSVEWVFDGKDVWIVQMNQLKTTGYKDVIVDGIVDSYIEFDVKQGLEALRHFISSIDNKNIGIIINGNIGITSHFGDLLRQSNIPSFIRRD